jgi:hypothetical protein
MKVDRDYCANVRAQHEAGGVPLAIEALEPELGARAPHYLNAAKRAFARAGAPDDAEVKVSFRTRGAPEAFPGKREIFCTATIGGFVFEWSDLLP